MTEIPAKTPRPMGKTDSLLPGSSKAAAAEADGVAVADSFCCAAVPVVVAVKRDDKSATATVDTPFGRIAPAAVVEAGAAVVAGGDGVVAGGDGVVVGGAGELAGEEAATSVGWAAVSEPGEEEAGAAVSVVTVAVTTLWVGAMSLGAASVVVAGASVGGACPPWLAEEDEGEAAPLLTPSIATLHFVTSSTASWPFESLMGVKVISQVVIIWPAGVFAVFVVCTVVG
jgi:hypothetical protein